jgi:hypothetical protein
MESEPSDMIADSKKNSRRPGRCLQQAPEEIAASIAEVWVSIFNSSVSLGTILVSWRKLIIKILYKGKGGLSDLDL